MLRLHFSSSTTSLVLRMFTLLMLFLIFRQKMSADAFFLAHRNLLTPFAFTQLGRDRHQQNHYHQKQQPDHLSTVYGTTTQKESIGSPLQPCIVLLPSERHIKSLVTDKHDAKLKPHSRRKRMHHLSMLRKIGDPQSVSSLSDIVLRHRHLISHQI